MYHRVVSVDRYAAARRKARTIAQWYNHALAYALVNTGLAVHNLVTTPEQLWFVYPLFGWGVGLACHAAQALELGGGSLWGPEPKARRLAGAGGDE